MTSEKQRFSLRHYKAVMRRDLSCFHNYLLFVSLSGIYGWIVRPTCLKQGIAGSSIKPTAAVRRKIYGRLPPRKNILRGCSKTTCPVLAFVHRSTTLASMKPMLQFMKQSADPFGEMMPAANDTAPTASASKLTKAGVALFWALVVTIVVARGVLLNSSEDSFGPTVAWIQRLFTSL